MRSATRWVVLAVQRKRWWGVAAVCGEIAVQWEKRFGGDLDLETEQEGRWPFKY